MSSEYSSERELLRDALAPGKDCLPPQSLEQVLDSGTVPPAMSRHLESCPHCRTELDLLRAFRTGPRDADEAAAADAIAARLRARSSEIISPAVVEGEPRRAWWRDLLDARWWRPAVVAMAGLLIVAAVGIQLRQGGAPRLHAPTGGEEILRSGSLALVSPTGDIGEVPADIRWDPVSGAAQYRVRLLEVDRTELWSATTAQSRIDLPASARSRFVPAKTILVQVTAFDAAGRQLAESELARVRVLQKLYKQ